jgi:hypothetical protein
MTFRIRELTTADIDWMFSGRREEFIASKIHDEKSDWLSLGADWTVAADDERHAYVAMLPSERDESGWRYMLAFDDTAVLVQKSGYQCFTVEAHSLEHFHTRRQVEEMFREAFRVGGLFILPNSSEVSKVQNATIDWGEFKS